VAEIRDNKGDGGGGEHVPFFMKLNSGVGKERGAGLKLSHCCRSVQGLRGKIL
jgi:hypothetical protein